MATLLKDKPRIIRLFHFLSKYKKTTSLVVTGLVLSIAVGHRIAEAWVHGQLENWHFLESMLAVAGCWAAIMFGLIGWFGSVVVEDIQKDILEDQTQLKTDMMAEIAALKLVNSSMQLSVSELGDAQTAIKGSQQSLEAGMMAEIENLRNLNNKIHGNISNLEEVVRLRLQGVPQILGRALFLLREARDEIFVMTFTAKFGDIHKIKYGGTNNHAVIVPGNKPKTITFDKAVEEYWEKFQAIFYTPRHFTKARLLTINSAGYADFVSDVAQRSGYSSLDVEQSIKELNASWQATQRLVANMNVDNSNLKGELKTTERLPFQMFLAKLKPSGEATKERWGCLVFLVGSDTAQHEEAAVGFYTELEDFIKMHQSVAEIIYSKAMLA